MISEVNAGLANTDVSREERLKALAKGLGCYLAFNWPAPGTLLMTDDEMLAEAGNLLAEQRLEELDAAAERIKRPMISAQCWELEDKDWEDTKAS